MIDRFSMMEHKARQAYVKKRNGAQEWNAKRTSPTTAEWKNIIKNSIVLSTRVNMYFNYNNICIVSKPIEAGTIGRRYRYTVAHTAYMAHMNTLSHSVDIRYQKHPKTIYGWTPCARARFE